MKLRFLIPSAAVAVLLAAPLCAQVKVTQGAGRIAVDIDGKPFTEFFIGADAPKPFLHPLRSASGKIITRRFPMEIVEGEARDHPHHRGLWFTHGDVNGYDFWMNEAGQRGDKKGRIVTVKVSEAKGGKKSGVVQAQFDWLDPKGGKLLTEDRTMTFYASPAGQRIIDFDIKLTPAVDVNFGDTKEGTFAIRLTTALQETKTGKMTSAEGKSGEKEVWGSRSGWVDYSGELEGEKLGVAILEHPSNPTYPTHWHSRAYGLFAANPFGESEFAREKTRRPGLTAKAGQPLRFRYRVIIHPGDTASVNFATLYQKYSKEK